MTVAPSALVYARPHRVNLQNPAAAVPNGDGSYTQSWIDLTPPTAWASIETAPANQERPQSGTTMTTATHIITIPFHPQITEHSRVLFNGRRFNVTGVSSPEERNIDSVLLCEELK